MNLGATAKVTKLCLATKVLQTKFVKRLKHFLIALLPVGLYQ